MEISTATKTQVDVNSSENKHNILDQLINLCISREASSIYFGEDSRVALRVNGKIIFIENIDILSGDEANMMINDILPNQEEKEQLKKIREINFSYTHKTGVNFRVTVFYQRDKLSVVMRMISKYIPTIEELNLLPSVKKLLDLKEGLILISGAAGVGKSTTIQSILQYINENFVKHIVTIENPIEHIFEDKKSIIVQREIGRDTLNITNALQSAIKSNPDVIMVDEINDMETLEHVLKLTETGHLVISSMLTRDAHQTIERMINFYPQIKQRQIQNRIADNLTAVLAQDLAERIDQNGLVPVCELVIVNRSIHNIIKHNNLNQLRTAVQSSAREGMITMDAYANQLAQKEIISHEAAENFAEYQDL